MTTRLDFLTPLVAPISADYPSGHDARLEPDHEQLRGEIGKLSALQGSGAPDWPRVEALGCRVLAQSKDLLVAIYVACAASVQRGVPGAAAGCALLVALLTNFGATLHPQRPRARLAALRWYVEWTARFLETVRAQSVADVQDLRARLSELREAAGGVFGEDMPSFAVLFQGCERVSLSVAATSSASTTQRAPSASGTPVQRAAAVSTGDASVVRASAPSAPIVRPLHDEASADDARDPRQVPRPSASAESPDAARYTFSAPPRDGQALHSYLLRAGAVLAELGACRFEADRADSRSYRWLRAGLWLRWERPPACNRHGRTDIDGPSPARRAELHRLLQADQWDDLLTLSEQLLAKNPLWLDLNRASALSLEKLGERFVAARAHVVVESRALAARLPGLAQLSFSDGTPLATAQTLDWLTPSAPQAEPSSGPCSHTSLLARVGQGDRTSFAELDLALRTCPSRRASFQLRLELARTLERAGQLPQAAQVYLGLERDIEEYQLERWEPELAVMALQPLLKLLSARDAQGSGQSEAARVALKLAQLSPTTLL